MADEITRNEVYLSAIAEGSSDVPEPITREEQYLAKIAGADVGIPEKAITRKEQYYKKIVDNGGGGGSATLIEKSISANGVYKASDDSADGYSKATVNVPNSYVAEDEGKVVSDGALVSQSSQNITENGTYDTTLKNSVNVEVPNSYAAGDEGKVVSNGALVSQTSETYTDNGTYNTTLKNSVTVNVSGASLGGLSEMVDTTDQDKGWAIMLSAMKNGTTVGGKITLTSNFTTTESLLLSTGLTTLNGFMFVGTDYKYGVSLGVGNSNMWVIISRYASNEKFGGTGFSQNLGWAGNSGMTEGTSYTSGASAFINGALRFDGGDIYYTARYNNNNAYQFIRSGTQYEWLAW